MRQSAFNAIFAGRFLTWETAKAEYDRRNDAMEAASDVLKKYPSNGPMGLTPEHIRLSAHFIADRVRFMNTQTDCQNFNGWFTKAYKKELRAFYNDRREARNALNNSEETC